MSFKLRAEQLVQYLRLFRELFNPDYIHRGVSLEKLKKLGRIPALQAALKTNFNKGLLNDKDQHINRRIFYGSNLPIIRQPKTLWQLVIKKFEDELIRVMVAAGCVSLVLGILTEGLKTGWIEGFSVFAAVALVISLSSIDDYAHEKEFQLIKGRLNEKQVRVYRGGKLYQLGGEELMVGDIIEVMGGDRIQVDGVLISGDDIMVDESEITGQAVEVKKRIPYTYDRSEGADPFLISSSQVMSGMGIMLVLAVGQYSYYGNLLSKMQEEHSDSPLKLKISDLSDEINELGVPIAIVTFSSLILHYLYHCFQSNSPLHELFSVQTLHKLVEAILVTFAIDVALPQSLPLSVTIALAHTAKKLQKKNVLVKYLNQSETMGGVDNICLTKTGFVTKNLLSVAEIFVEERITNIISRETMSEDTCRLLSLAIVMNSLATPRFIQQNGHTLKIEHIGNKTQSALLQMAYLMGYNYQRFRLNSRVKRIYTTGPPKKKMASVYRDERGKLYLFVKGSPNFILPYITSFINRDQQIEPIGIESRSKIEGAITHFNKMNLKIVMIIYKEINSVPSRWSQVEKNFTLIAIVGIKDFLRPGVRNAVEECQKSGITVRLLSNQSRNTAIGAAKDAGILNIDWMETSSDYTAIEGSDFRQLVGALAKNDPRSLQSSERRLAIQNFKQIKESLRIIYRASAEDKYLLTVGLRECGHVVAMAGNGTNDTEALRKADVSISMGRTGNQTAKEASDIVFLDDNFGSILKTIKWGRHTFNSIRKFLVLQLTINIVASMMALLGAIFLGESPLNPMQMLWTNILIDFLGSIGLILQKPRNEDISKHPYSRRDKILTPSMLKIIIFQSITQVIILSIILFFGPDLFGIVSSVGVQQWSKQTGKHYSLFFNVFIMLQIFNEFNARELNFNKLNVFSGLQNSPIFLCFIVFSLSVQFVVIKQGGKWLHIIELSFKQNMLCLTLGSLSLFSNYLFKLVLPQHLYISRKGFQLGKFSYRWATQSVVEEQQLPQMIVQLFENNVEALSPQFSEFMMKRKNRYQGYSYMQSKESLKLENCGEESLTQEQDEELQQ